MKKCYLCKKEKDESEFYKNKAKSSGLADGCKDCQKERSKIFKEKNPEIIKERKRDEYCRNRDKYLDGYREYYKKNRETMILQNREYSRKEENKDKARIRNREFKRRKRELIKAKLLIEEDYKKRQRSAQDKVSYALKTGKLIKPEKCEKCSEIKPLQGHHEDYKKPLEVMWLCYKCHCQQHNKLMDIL